MALWISMIVRNEASRHLIRTLDNICYMDGKAIITDDCSDDDTAGICEDYGHYVQRSDEPLFWKHEGYARQRHLEFVNQYARKGDWVLALDADETVSHPEDLSHTIHAAELLACRAVSLPLYEFWSEDEYRVDGWWFGTQAPVLYKWQPDGHIRQLEMGCGREPTYVHSYAVGDQVFKQTHHHLQHWGYLWPEDRIRKHRSYTERLGGHGHNNAHVNSIVAEPMLRTYERR